MASCDVVANQPTIKFGRLGLCKLAMIHNMAVHTGIYDIIMRACYAWLELQYYVHLI